MYKDDTTHFAPLYVRVNCNFVLESWTLAVNKDLNNFARLYGVCTHTAPVWLFLSATTTTTNIAKAIRLCIHLFMEMEKFTAVALLSKRRKNFAFWNTPFFLHAQDGNINIVLIMYRFRKPLVNTSVLYLNITLYC